jgi:glutamyl-tRNA synthetase
MSMSGKKIRVRFAPSPTGFLHVGGARTALFNWLWARRNGGTFILRIEDTDVDRSTRASMEQILSSLRWLGLDWDEGPYFQSQRLEIYQDQIRKLWAAGKIYPAFESKEELEAMRERALAEGGPSYDGRAGLMPRAEAEAMMAAGRPFVWRFRTPRTGYTVVPETLLNGDAECRFENARIGDFIITRPGTVESPGMPLYNFVCTVDDALMEITHVIRGADHLTNTAKQVLIYEAMGYPVPSFTHLPLIMKNNKKMSKRDEEADPRFPVSVSARRDLGYLEEATINFLALLGWSYSGDREFLTREELIESFSLERLQKSNANFDEDKYLHMNAWYIRNLPRAAIVGRVRQFLMRADLAIEGKDDAWYARIIDLVADRCRLLSDFPAALEYFFRTPLTYEHKGVKKFFMLEDTALRLAEITDVLERVEPFESDQLEPPLREYAERVGIGFGRVAQTIRLAVTGSTASPSLFEVMEILGRDTVIRRLRKALDHISGRATEEDR